jgi:hypothetical protein
VTDWASVGTAVGTLVLAGATFAAVRSGNRSARIAERTLLAGLRPVLVPGPRDDRGDQVLFADGRVLEVGGGRGTVEEADGVVYLALPLANVGSGLALLLGYRLESQTAEQTRDDPLGPARHRRGDAAPDPSTFRPQQRDLYIAPGRVGFWQAALRDPADELHSATIESIRTGGRITVDLLYGDHEGGQPTITRFVLLHDEPGWRCDVTRHWSLDPGAVANARPI